MKKLLSFLFLLLLLTSCDPNLDVTYQIKNIANNRVEVTLLLHDDTSHAVETVILNQGKKRKIINFKRTEVVDTITININQGDTFVLETTHYLGTPSMEQQNPKQYLSGSDTLIARKDTIPATKNFKDVKEWDLHTTSKSSVIYELVIDDTDFQ